jgi:hypothetical protein
MVFISDSLGVVVNSDGEEIAKKDFRHPKFKTFGHFGFAVTGECSWSAGATRPAYNADEFVTSFWGGHGFHLTEVTVKEFSVVLARYLLVCRPSIQVSTMGVAILLADQQARRFALFKGSFIEDIVDAQLTPVLENNSRVVMTGIGSLNRHMDLVLPFRDIMQSYRVGDLPASVAVERGIELIRTMEKRDPLIGGQIFSTILKSQEETIQ